MKEAQFEYKCRRCGEIYYNPCCDPDDAEIYLIDLSIFGKAGDSERGGTFRKSTTHQCKDGGRGFCDLIGYKIVE